MKFPFLLNFQDEREEKEFKASCTAVDSNRVFVYISIIFAFEVFLLVYDSLTRNTDYSTVQWIYRILNTYMAAISAIFIILNITRQTWLSKKDPEQSIKIFRIASSVYAVLLLAGSIADAITGTVSSGRENLTMYFISLMLVSCVFYVNSFVVFSSGVGFFILFELFTHLTSYSSHHTYAPYPIFIIFITVSVSFVRRSQRLELIRNSLIIKKLQEQAERENKLKSQFLANMSHEIRTPMNAIVGMSELALDFNLNDTEKNIIRQIRTSGISLVGIINDILDFSKIESGKMEIVPEDYELVRLMNDIANVVLVRLQGKDVELRLEIDPLLPSVLNGDDMRLRQILINLAGNSAKFTEHGHVAIRVENLQNYEQHDGLRISVIDTGVGIRKEDLDKLFGAFQQVDMKMNRNKGGTGLGLSISKNLVQLMGGSIGVQSEYGKGSLFYINVPQKIVDATTCLQKYLPLFEAADKLAIKTDTDFYKVENLTVIPVVSLLNRPEFAKLFAEKNTEVKFTAPDANVLVVDDNDVNIQVAQGLLRKFAVNPDCLTSGYEALEKVFTKDYDIIFMDHQMPGMDGVETLQKIREKEKNDGSHRIIVALSANAINGAREMFIKNGFDDFVAKPVQGKDFGECLIKHLPKKLIIRATGAEDEENESTIPQDFPSVKKEKIDIDFAVSNAGGIDNYLVIAKTFYNSISNNSSLIEYYFTEKDIKNYTIQVHALKSSARIIGAADLSKKAEYLESLGKRIQQNPDDPVKEKIIKYTPVLLNLYRSYTDDLKPIVDYEATRAIQTVSAQDESDGLTEELSKEDLHDIFLRIAEASKNCDLDTAEQEFIAIRKAKFDPLIKEKIKELEDAIDSIELEKITELAESLSNLY
ncbi:MAG: response regulator [Treponema sp.]|nr:response regulator [Treponema sp.]